MVKAVASELQERIEQLHRQAFAAGYAEAMKAVRDLASRPARNSGNGAAEPNRRGQGRVGGRSAAAHRLDNGGLASNRPALGRPR